MLNLPQALCHGPQYDEVNLGLNQLRHLKSGDELQLDAVAQPLPFCHLKGHQFTMPNVGIPLNAALVVVEDVQGDLNLADRLMDFKLGLHHPPLNVAQLLLNVIYDDRALRKQFIIRIQIWA